MKISAKIVFLLFLFAGFTSTKVDYVPMVHALQNPNQSVLNPTPLPEFIQSTAGPTATIDPASIGDTSGVIALGMIVVLVILVGVLWGSHEFRMETRKNRSPKE